jgi:hypothetical protein
MQVEELRKVYQQVQNCLENVVGGSGHLASFSMIPDTFKIIKTEPVGDQGTRYYFSAKAFRESEFTVYEEGKKPESEAISGSIVLDSDLALVRNENGQVLLEPWKCMQPIERKPLLSTREKVKQDLYGKLTRADQILHILIDEMNFQRDEKISRIIEEIQYRLKGIQTTSESGRIEYIELEDMYLNVIIGVMDQDRLAPDDEVKFLIESVRNRIDHFDEYFDRLQKGTLKEPFNTIESENT